MIPCSGPPFLASASTRAVDLRIALQRRRMVGLAARIDHQRALAAPVLVDHPLAAATHVGGRVRCA